MIMRTELPIKENKLCEGSILKGRYEIRAFLGEGWTGQTYLAYDRNLRINVALKFLDKKHYPDKELITRFYTEAEIGALLNHQNINRVYNVEEIDDRHCIVMDFVEGEKPGKRGKTLEEVINEKKTFFEPEEACNIIMQVLDALKHAHAYTDKEKGIEGIIHRDINPSNIMVAGDGTVKVMDFGVAKILVKEGTNEQRLVTEEFKTMGTATYMSPEQTRSEKLTGKTDVFSTAIMFYKIVTGILPFGNREIMDSKDAMMNIRTKKLIRPRRIKSQIPAKLENILLKTLEKNPDKRYTAEEFYQALNSYLQGNPVKVKGIIRRRINLFDRRDFMKTGLIGGALILGGGATVIIKNWYEYEKSLFSTLDKIQKARTWDEMRPYLKELKMNLFDWVLERSKYLKKDAAALYFNENKTVEYTTNSYHGFHFIREIYELGFKETQNTKFLELFAHYYGITTFNETKTYQYYLDRFKIDADTLRLLKEINFRKIEEFQNKMKAAIQHLITERYNRTGKFFQYINKNDEESNEQALYARTQFNIIPLLIEGFKIFDIKKDFGREPSQYLDLVINQTRTSNKVLVGRDHGVHFGAFIYVRNYQPPKFFFRSGHSNIAYLSEDITKYMAQGLYPVIKLYENIEEATNNKNQIIDIKLRENINALTKDYLKIIKKEKDEIIRTLFGILAFYRKHLNINGKAPYYDPILGDDFKENNPFSLSSTITHFNFLNSLLNDIDIFKEYLPRQDIRQFSEERMKIAKSIYRKEEFNRDYSPSDNQSFFKKMVCDISDPAIINLVETEKEALQSLSKIK